MLVISGIDTASGTFQASAGTLQFNAAYEALGFGSIKAQAGAVVQYANTTLNGGFLRGPGTHTTMPGTSNYFSGTTTYASTVFLQNGSDTFTNFTNGGEVTNNAPLVWDGGINNGGASLTVNSTVSADDFTNAGVITINNGGALNNHLSDMTGYGGGRIAVNSGGTLNADSQSEGVALDLQDSLLVNNGNVTGTTNVYYGATVSGSGSFGPINVFQGGTLAISPSAGPIVPSLVVSSGSITGAGQSAAPIDIVSAAVDTPNPTDTLTLSGSLSGGGPLVKSGAGTLILSGSYNTYGGGTAVLDGTLILTNPGAIADGSNLTVGDAAAFAPAPVVPADVAGLATEPPSAAIAPVPEPGTLALLVAGAALMAMYRKRR
jgi:autotransporter-associated beta strand protein